MAIESGVEFPDPDTALVERARQEARDGCGRAVSEIPVDEPYYVVMRVCDQQASYSGRSQSRAAYWMKPGTVCGRGRTRGLARADAKRQIEEVRRVT